MKYQRRVGVWALEFFQDLQKNEKLIFVIDIISDMWPDFCKIIENWFLFT